MDDFQFMKAALSIGLALRANRTREDFLRQAGRDDEANTIYLANKEAARALFLKLGITAKEFDTRMNKLGKSHGRRLNVKLERLFG